MVALQILEAAEEGDVDLLQSFDRAVTEEVSDDLGANCMHYAARQASPEVLVFLVKQRGFTGKKRSNIGATPAHDAAASGNLETLKWLLKNTACDVADQDGIGMTVLHLSCRFSHTQMTDWILNEGNADSSQKTASRGIPLHFAVLGGDLEAVTMLLQDDPRSVNLQTGNGATPVYLAAQEGQLDILRLLVLEMKGNVKMKAFDGMSCLHAAAQQGHLDCVKFLVKEPKCNPVDRDFDGATSIHYAASRGHAEVIDWLMKHGGGKITLDNLGGSPLHNAVEMGHVNCALTLLNNGCSPAITDNNGLTAEELARKCYHGNCADIISSYGNQLDLEDPDLVYLAEVQSPRPLQPVSQSGPRLVQIPPTLQPQRHFQPIVREETYISRQQIPVVEPPEDYPSSDTCFQSNETGECESNTSTASAQADSIEFILGTRRSVDSDFTTGIGPSVQSNLSSSVSSLSSTSHTDEAALPDSVWRADPKLSPHPPIRRKINQPELLTPLPVSLTEQGTSGTISGPSYSEFAYHPHSHAQSHLPPVQGQGVATGPGQLPRKPSVSFLLNPDEEENSRSEGGGRYSKRSMNIPPAEYLTRDVVIEEKVRVQNGRMPQSVSSRMADNGRPINGHSYSKTPVEDYIDDDDDLDRSVTAAKDNVSNVTKASGSTYSVSTNTVAKAKTPIATVQPLPPVAPPPPPPPPPPPAPIAPQSNLLNGSTAPVVGQNQSPHQLTARPMSLLTKETLANTRKTLSPTPTHVKVPGIKSPGNGNPDLIAELKKAAGGNALRKISKPSVTPSTTMVFAFGSGQATNGSSEKLEKSPSAKESLTGEWNPKNFVGKVPDQDPSGVPVPPWKKQVLARQLAEKTMVETVEKRKVDERESRFKNMPAWKRAIIERKEAEAKAEEEKKSQPQVKPTKRTPAIGLVGNKMAPWQQELQEKKE